MSPGASLRTPPGWELVDEGRAIRREYVLKDFAEAVALIGRIAARAEAADHHPDLSLTRYRRLEVVLTTHDAGGLTERDVKLAAEIEALPKALKG